MIKRKLAFFVFLLSTALFFANKGRNIQSSTDPVRSISNTLKSIIYENPNSSDHDIKITLAKIMQLAKSNHELSNAFYCLADVLYKKADFSNAILLFKKVDSVTAITGNDPDRLMANLFLANMYGKLALKNQATDRFVNAEKLVKKINVPDATLQLEYQKSSYFEENLLWCDAIPIKKKLINYFESKVRENKENRYRINLAITYTELAYTLLKCENNIREAQFYLLKYDEIFQKYPREKNYLLPQYYIDKGIISAESNDFKSAKQWFDAAYKIAQSESLESLKLRCMEEQIKYGLLDINLKKSYFDSYFIRKNELKKHAEKVIAREQLLIEKNEVEKSQKYVGSILVVSLLVFLLLVFLFWNRQRKMKVRFQEIIENVKKQKPMSSNEAIQHSEKLSTGPIAENNSQINVVYADKRLMSEEKEKELLQKIEDFEKTELFTDEKFTMGKFASVLESNAKYINYVLQKYKGHTFSDYLNELRIKFIVNKLIEKPEYLNYKISYLAKISGFTSHSRFTYIFKNVLNISPSEFISQLNRQNKNGL